MAKRLALLACGIVLFGAAEARACAVIVRHPHTWGELQREARETVARASVILDGEVVEPSHGDVAARVRVVRVFKGTVGDHVYVRAETSCDIDFVTAGERWRLVLFGGPDVYHTYEDYSNARAIDRILKSDRRKDWPLSLKP